MNLSLPSDSELCETAHGDKKTRKRGSPDPANRPKTGYSENTRGALGAFPRDRLAGHQSIAGRRFYSTGNKR